MVESSDIARYRLNVFPDVPDFRDWQFSPSLRLLKRHVSRPGRLRILDQGGEGSCTGFALAAAVNLLRRRNRRRGSVSPRMLYEMAKRHDEWRGYRGEGSSCRGAIKGWYNMGVCLDSTWPYVEGKPGHLTIRAAKEARKNTLGAYYRLGTRISDFHSALNEAGVIYCSAELHGGWDLPTRQKPLIPLRQDKLGGHAFIIVGYNAKGFWIQNSWGRNWAENGTALWSYEDWQENLYDAWVFALALPTPQIWHLPQEGGSDAARAGALFDRTPTRAEIAGHFVHVDDGAYHASGRYWSNADDVTQTAKLLAKSSKYDHLLFYAHGGLNSVKASARRIAAMKETFKANRIYPYHFMYDTGLLEELKDIVVASHRELAGRAGGLADWMDLLIERACRVPGRALWREMKRGAERPFLPGGAGTSVLEILLGAIQENRFRLHIVGHSAGAVFLGYLLQRLAGTWPRQRVATASLLAPAATVALFRRDYLPLLQERSYRKSGIGKLDIYNLSDQLERDDSVALAYRKSVLYLVSRALEEEPLPAPLLGLVKDSRRLTSESEHLSIRVSNGEASGNALTRSLTHGNFDNDPATMNAVLRRVLGRKPAEPFSEKSLRY